VHLRLGRHVEAVALSDERKTKSCKVLILARPLSAALEKVGLEWVIALVLADNGFNSARSTVSSPYFNDVRNAEQGACNMGHRIHVGYAFVSSHFSLYNQSVS
jgi:hypothetical protein